MQDNQVRVSVEVEEKELDPSIGKAFKELARQVNLPGFRRGKAPRRVLESHFGKGIVRGHALEDAIPEFFLSAIAEHEVDIIAPPEYDVTAGEEEGDLTFDAVVQVRPVINIGGYDALKIEITNPTPGEEEIDEQIDRIRGQFSQLETVERAAELGDHLTIDINGTYDGEAVEGLTAEDYVYELGSGAVVPEIDENLEGANVGDSVEFDAAHPDPDEEGDLQFVVDVKQVQEKVLPELDDEFVQGATEFETVEALRKDTVERLTKMKTSQANNEMSDKTAKALSRLVEIDAPEPLVNSEANERLQEMAFRMQQQGIEFAQYLQLTGSTIEELQGQMRGPAEESVKVDLALRAVAVAEGLEATDEDVDNEFEQLVAQTGQDVASLRKEVSAANQMVAIRSDIGKRKAVDWLLERVEIVDQDGNAIDRADLEMPEEDHDHEHGDHADHDHDNQDDHDHRSDDDHHTDDDHQKDDDHQNDDAGEEE